MLAVTRQLLHAMCVGDYFVWALTLTPTLLGRQDGGSALSLRRIPSKLRIGRGSF